MRIWIWLFLSVFSRFTATNNSEELVLVDDINSDHERRHLDAGLPSVLRFVLKRETGNVTLTLEENRRLNANAPVYEVDKDSQEKRTLVKQKSVPVTRVRYYHDKENSGAFSVRCELTNDGPCRRILTGNLYIGGHNYDIEPTPDTELKRHLDKEEFGTPHFLTENMIRKEDLVNVRNFEIPDTRDIKDDGRLVINDENQLEEDLDTVDERYTDVRKLYAVEIYVVLDPSVWNKFYATTTKTGALNRVEVTELRLREYFSHIINGVYSCFIDHFETKELAYKDQVALRLESIEDPEFEIYCTIAGFLILKNRDWTNPLPAGWETVDKGRAYANDQEYIDSSIEWAQTLQNVPPNDHIMVFTAYELYSGSFQKKDIAVEGVAYLNGICGNYRLSLNEAEDFFTTTSVATHELAHNLGSSHDGTGSSKACASDGDFIMSPYVASFNEKSMYSVNPWRFSKCSVKAIKTLIKKLGSRNCMNDPGEYYNHEEYLEHTSLLPGQLHDPDSQCKLTLGENSRLCSSTKMNRICLVMKCLTPRGTCRLYAAARGTACGETDSDNELSGTKTYEEISEDKKSVVFGHCNDIALKFSWCIDGACVSRNSYERPVSYTLPKSTLTTPSTTESTKKTTTVSERSVDPNCMDVGLYDNYYTCSEIRKYYADTTEFCKLWEAECCETCRKAVTCHDHGYFDYSCETILNWYGLDIASFCHDFETVCCATCRNGGLITSTISTTPATTTPSGTELFQCSGNIGYDGLTCSELEEIHGNKYKMCFFYTAECCETCAKRCPGNQNINLSGTTYTCEDVLLNIFKNHINAFCRAYGRDCCNICT